MRDGLTLIRYMTNIDYDLFMVEIYMQLLIFFLFCPETILNIVKFTLEERKKKIKNIKERKKERNIVDQMYFLILFFLLSFFFFSIHGFISLSYSFLLKENQTIF